MGSITLPQSGHVYLDTSPIIYSVEKIDPYRSLLQPLWVAAQNGQFTLVGSELLLLETLIKPVQQKDTVLEKSFRQLLASREFQLLPITSQVLEQAVSLRASLGIKTPDAIHAATALLANSDLFVTNDKVFHRVPKLNVVVLKDVLTS
jgi:predicted nucleic acid-binding protein